MTTVQRVYGKGRYDGIIIGIMIGVVFFLALNYFSKKGEQQFV